MSFLRRAATVSVLAASLALGAGVAAPAAVAGGWPGGHRQEPPLMFGPIEIPRDGAVSGGFSWSMH